MLTSSTGAPNVGPCPSCCAFAASTSVASTIARVNAKAKNAERKLSERKARPSADLIEDESILSLKKSWRYSSRKSVCQQDSEYDREPGDQSKRLIMILFPTSYLV